MPFGPVTSTTRGPRQAAAAAITADSSSRPVNGSLRPQGEPCGLAGRAAWR